MSCCGGNKNRVISTGLGSVPQPQAETIAPVRASAVVFRYDGVKPTTVYGKVTGRKYWFGEQGAEVVVDLRDRTGMRAVKDVREVRLV
jgi:hypothetical protein